MNLPGPSGIDELRSLVATALRLLETFLVGLTP